ncbi:MAG TPA: pilus assembly protein TadG-related protein [Patescibacteria group bacterium]|nr:pilus assembly protein TadG-related protein [Patescibacteria group bacterium]
MIRKNDAGQALPLVAAALVALLAVMGLSIDMGVMRYDKRLQQTAADAAAIAGAQNLSSGAVTARAQDASSLNGYADNSTTTTCTKDAGAVGCIKVTVNNPPTSGPHLGNSKYVEVLVADSQPTYFMKILGVDSETVVARAVATNVGSSFGDGGGGGCIVTTGTPTEKLTANNSGFGTSGSVILNAPTCGILDNGNLIANGGTNLSINAGSIGVGGTYSAPSQEDCSANPPVGVCPAPCADGSVCGMPYSGDPLSGKYPVPATAPSLGTVDIINGSCKGTGCSGVACAAVGSVTPCTISPGIYDDICIESGQIVDFSDGGSTTGGLFVITGNSVCNNSVDFKMAGGATVCSSTNADCSNMPASENNGVTFYMGGTNASAHSAGTTTVELNAPNSGTYEGLLFYQAAGNASTMTLIGTNTSFYQGTIYTADTSAQLYFGGNAGFNEEAKYTLIDVGQLTLAGNPDVSLNSDYSGLSNGGGPLSGMTSTAVLVE